MSKKEYLKVKKTGPKSVKTTFTESSNPEYEKEINIEYLRDLYNTNGGFEYTDEQLLSIKRFLFRMTEITIDCYKRLKLNNSNLHKHENSNSKKESDSVCESQYGRTG